MVAKQKKVTHDLDDEMGASAENMLMTQAERMENVQTDSY